MVVVAVGSTAAAVRPVADPTTHPDPAAAAGYQARGIGQRNRAVVFGRGNWRGNGFQNTSDVDRRILTGPGTEVRKELSIGRRVVLPGSSRRFVFANISEGCRIGCMLVCRRTVVVAGFRYEASLFSVECAHLQG